MISQDKTRVFGLDFLRCFAVLLVLAHHSRFFLLGDEATNNRETILGFLGVEIFFVLSGFLVGGIFIRDLAESQDLASLKTFWISY